MTAGREVVLRAGWAAPGALRALRAGGDGRVAVALREGAYLELPGGCLLLAPPRSPVGPLTLLVDAPARGLRTGAAVVRDGDALRTDGVRIALDRVRPLAPAPPPPPRMRDVGPALAAALAGRDDPPPGLLAGLAALRAGDEAAAVALLAGRGPGLTPAGDDVLAGYAAWRHADGAAPRLDEAARTRSGPLGLAYLRCAQRGELTEAGRRVLHAVRRADPRAAARAAGALDRWGATSGRALLWGMAAAARRAPTPVAEVAR